MYPSTEALSNKWTATLLVVDDQEQNLDFFRSALESNYRLWLAQSGAQACEFARLGLPDLVLLDVMMPHQDGFATAQALGTIPGMDKVPLIFLTALSDDKTREFGLELGAVDFLIKPIRLAALRQSIAKALLGNKQAEV
ncbi:MAG: response regulator [Burkholderiaceae bacterium]